MTKASGFAVGDVFAEAGTPLTWPLPWPSRLVVAIGDSEDVYFPNALGITRRPATVAKGDVLWLDIYGTGLCSTRHFRRRNEKYDLVLIGNLSTRL